VGPLHFAGQFRQPERHFRFFLRHYLRPAKSNHFLKKIATTWKHAKGLTVQRAN
jgi:hypothetical protein